MKTKLVFFILLFSVVFASFAQSYDNYPLKDYYTPDIQRRSLEFDITGNFKAEKDDKHLLNLFQESRFHSLINTRKKISNLFISFSFREKNAKGMEDYNKYQSFSAYTGIDYDEKRYVTPKFFFQYAGGIAGTANPIKETRIEHDAEKGYIDMDYKIKTYSFRGYAKLGAGIGRIENITDARQALYILDALSKNGRLKKQLSNDEVFTFSQLISSVKNKRFLDARLHRMDEITQVDSFLVAGNYLEKNDAAYFTTLYDLWLYGDLFERKSGQEYSVYSSYRHQYSYGKTSKNGIENNPYRSPHNDFSTGVIYNFEKPIRLSWQHSFNTSLNYYYTNGFEGKTINNSIDLPIKYSLGYYPNTRTHFQLSIEERLGRLLQKRTFAVGDTEYKEKFENLSADTSLSLNTYYYVSPHLLLSAKAVANLIFSKYKVIEKDPNLTYPDNSDSNSDWNTNIEFKVTYKLF